MGPSRALVEIVIQVLHMEQAFGFYCDRLGLELFSPPALPAKFRRLGEREGVPA